MKSLIGFMDAVNASWQLIQKNLATFLLVGVAGQVILTFLTFWFIPTDKLSDYNAASEVVPMFNITELFSGLAIVFLLSLIVGTLISAALVILTIKTSKGESVSLQSLLQDALKIFFPFLGLEILVGIVVLVGFILLIVPGIIFSIWFFASVFILVEQNKGIIGSMKASKNLVSGHVMEIFVRFLLGVLAVFVASFVFGLVTVAFSSIPILEALLQSVLSGLASIASIVFGYVIYSSLKEIKSSPSAPSTAAEPSEPAAEAPQTT
jgi:hypothetical protein